jgi:hypothetical protein
MIVDAKTTTSLSSERPCPDIVGEVMVEMTPCIAVRDAISGVIWTALTGVHIDLIIAAERELGIARQPGNDRFVAGYLEGGQFVTGLRRVNKFTPKS